VAALTGLALHRASAAARHVLWTLAIAGCLLMPLLMIVLPDWRLAAVPDLRPALLGLADPRQDSVRFPDDADGTRSEVDVAAPFPAEIPPAEDAGAATTSPETVSEAGAGAAGTTSPVAVPWYVWAWGAGALAVLAFFAAAARQLHAIVGRSMSLDDPDWREDAAFAARSAGLPPDALRLRRSIDSITPMTWGVRRPVIVLPRDCQEWSAGQRREVLLHEAGHVGRRDCLTQWLANLACIVYWCQPLVWWAARRMLTERERACDDRVLRAGATPSAYAQHLLDIARNLGAGRRSVLAGVAMARRSQVSGRLLAILDPGCNRGGPRRSHVLAAAAATLVALSTLAALTPGRLVHAAPMGALAGGRPPDGSDTANEPSRPAVRWSLQGIRGAIDRGNLAIETAVGARDGEAASRVYSNDAVLFGMGGEERHGRRQVAELYASLFAQGYRELAIEVEETLRLDDGLVHELGRFTYFHENGRTHLRGRYMSIWRLEDGEWLVYRDISNI